MASDTGTYLGDNLFNSRIEGHVSKDLDMAPSLINLRVMTNYFITLIEQLINRLCQHENLMLTH